MNARLDLGWQTKQSSWMRRRIAPGAHVLGKQSIFILPTRQGFYLVFFLLAMLLACINYNLSLGYMLTFFVFSVALGAMHRTHQNLLGTRIEALAGAPVYADQAPTISIHLSHNSAAVKHAVIVSTRPASSAAALIQTSLASQSARTHRFELPPLPRGVHAMPELEMSSVYPLGLWRAWSYAFPDGKLTVYPQPHSPLPVMRALPMPVQSAASGATSSLQPQGDAVSHIEHADSASAKTIHWPALAKGQLAQRILETDSPVPQAVLLSLADCTVDGIEAQLSQLCFAILHCEAAKLPFVLQLDDDCFPASKQACVDAAHVELCLQALAAHGYDNA